MDTTKKEVTPEEIIALKDEQIAGYETRIGSLEEKIEGLLKLSGQTSSAAADGKKKPVIPEEPVTVGKDKYKFKFATFIFDTVHYEAADAALDAKLLANIIKVEGQGILVKVF